MSEYIQIQQKKERKKNSKSLHVSGQNPQFFVILLDKRLEKWLIDYKNSCLQIHKLINGLIISALKWHNMLHYLCYSSKPVVTLQ